MPLVVLVVMIDALAGLEPMVGVVANYGFGRRCRDG